MLRLILVLALWATAAEAEPAYVRFTTWLRDAPDASAAVIDEVRAGEQVQRSGCDRGWCRVGSTRTTGWVAETMLAAGASAALVPAAQGCFAGQHLTPAGALALTICPAR